MRVWIINPFDDIPGEGKPQRYWALAATLAAQGHKVIWWSSDWSHRRKARRTSNVQHRTSNVELGAGAIGSEPPRPLGTPPCQGGESEESVSGGRRLSSQVVGIGTLSSGGVDSTTQPPNDSTTQSYRFQLRLIPTPSYQKNISFARIWNHRKFGQNLYRDACAAVDSGELLKPDVIVASLPPMESPIMALRLRQRYGCRVVTDVMDTWPATLLQAVPSWVSGLGRLLLQPYWQMLRKACAESDAICAQSHAFADFARSHGAAGEIHVCYLGADRVEPRAPMSKEPPYRCAVPPSLEKEGSQEGPERVEPRSEGVDVLPARLPTFPPRSLRLLYLGAMGRSYDLATILEAVRILNSENPSLTTEASAPRIECVFVGDGEKRAALEAQQIPGCRFTGFLDGEALDRELQSADIGVVPFFNESGVAVPYKAGDYLAYGLPLLSTIDGELGGLIRKHQCGSVYRAEDAEGLASAIRQYVENPTLLNQAKAGAGACFSTNFDRAQTYPNFADWITGGGR